MIFILYHYGESPMLEALLGTKNRELTLQYLLVFKEGYAREIAKYFNASLPSIQNQLKHFEESGLALSKMSGRTKVYFLNPRYAFLEEIIALLNKVRPYYKPELKEKFEMQRKRPRRPGKPL
jgi:transposase